MYGRWNINTAPVYPMAFCAVGSLWAGRLSITMISPASVLYENLFDIDLKHRTVHGTIMQERSGHA
ncbi:hypothetical protein GFGA_2d0045 (plasmid) [Gluconobacter frateurii NBRC 103465]|nr:hypothetical protein GFGA_2d0045 [Gluconobacter frateurii NBRC 103465]